MRRTDDLSCNALLLIRATGIRISMHASASGLLATVGTNQWALYVPLGKLHTERLVPADPKVRRIIDSLLGLRALGSPAQFSQISRLPAAGLRW